MLNQWKIPQRIRDQEARLKKQKTKNKQKKTYIHFSQLISTDLFGKRV